MSRFTIFPFLFILLLIFLVLYFANRKNNVKLKQDRYSGSKLSKILKETEQRYTEYIEKLISNYIIQYDSFNFDSDTIIKEAVSLFKPQIETVISYVNAASGTIEVPYKGKLFPNLASLAEHLARKKQSKLQNELSAEDKKSIFTAFEDSIKSDLSERKFKLKAGDVI